jgi:hypothetical protein
MRTFSCFYLYNTIKYIINGKELGESYWTFKIIQLQYHA